MPPRTVLVPLDGSALSEQALPYAAAIARLFNAPVRLLAVVDPNEGGRDAALREHHTAMLREGLTSYLALAAARLRDDGIACSTDLRDGDPVAEILAAADDDTSITVMATHGRGGFRRWLLGSLADKVLRLSDRPVLLISPSADAPPAGSVELRRLLVPLDGSQLAEEALPLALDLARAAGASLLLMRVEPYPPVWPPGATPDLEGMNMLRIEAAREYLQNVRATLPQGLAVETWAEWGYAFDRLSHAVDDGPIDLVVMTTRGQGGLKRLVLGSTADRLVRSGAPSLLIPPAASASPGTGA